jgi:hypothetical protein
MQGFRKIGMTRALLLTLALMCENVNAAPITVPCGEWNSGAERATTSSCAGAPSAPPFALSHPLCATGFTMAQRFDMRDRFGIIVKREWKMTGCAKGRIVYGRKV